MTTRNSITPIVQRIVFAGAMIALTLIASCKSDEPGLTPEQRVTKILTENGGTWKLPAIAGVTVDGLDVTKDLFPGFSITFGEGTLTTTGTTPVWLRQDTWTFKDETATAIIRGQDGKEITISEITTDQLILTLEWDKETYDDETGRSKSIKGTYQFALDK
jgi:hypothetical protein